MSHTSYSNLIKNQELILYFERKTDIVSPVLVEDLQNHMIILCLQTQVSQMLIYVPENFGNFL